MFQVLLSYNLNLELNLIFKQMHKRNIRSKTCTESFTAATKEYSEKLEVSLWTREKFTLC